MSVHIKPCHGCPLRTGCQLRNEFRSKVHGLGLRSASFACPILDEKLQPGTRIEIGVPIFGPDQYDESYHFTGRHKVKATILSSKNGSFSCVVDPEHQEFMVENGGDIRNPGLIRFRKTQKHHRIIRWLDEPKRERCEVGSIKLPDGTCDVPNGEQCACQWNKEAVAA